jgi:Zn-finger nucleic acid-binding protein
VLRVKAAKGHDAAVVQCSGCGAPREKHATACEHCSSDFTLHEQDLHTVCPHCMTRVSDKARFCHSCGTTLTASKVAGEPSKVRCPSCKKKPLLHSRRLGNEDFSMLECQLCAGMWIELRIFEELANKAKAQDPIDAALLNSKAVTGRQEIKPEKWSYRHCPECGEMMQRRNYGRRSGVIVDACRDHGIWFDADELQQILAWIRGGGMQVAQRRQASEQRSEAAHRRTVAPAERPATGDGSFMFAATRSSGVPLVDALIDTFFG